MSQAEVLKTVREIGPCTTMEVVRRIHGDVPSWERGSRRSRVYNSLRICERHGEVTRTVEDGDAIWRCVE